MDFKDYYKTLGVERSASDDEIKKSYRKLARKYHPDVSKEKNAEEKFKEVAEAYETLKNKEKKSKYDQLLSQGFKGGDNFERPNNWDYNQSAGNQHHQSAQFSDFFSDLFGQQTHGQAQHFKMQGDDVHYKMEISLADAYHGVKKQIAFQSQEPNQNGQLIQKVKKLNVNIPAGMFTGQHMRLKSQGGVGSGGAPNGDLYLEITVLCSKGYSLNDKNVSMILPITPWEAALGTKISLHSLAGKFDIKIPAGSQSGTKLRVKGKGVPSKVPGDLFLELQIQVPNKLSKDEVKHFEELGKLSQFNPRDNMEKSHV